MLDTHLIGKWLIFIGGVIILIGLFFWAGGKIPWLGKLPGDIAVVKGNFRFYFPVTTSVLLSLLLSLIIYLFGK